MRRLVVLLLLAALAAGVGFAAASAAILRDDVPPAVSQAAREVRERVTRTAREAAGRAAGEAAERAPGPRVTSLRKARCPEGAEAPCRAVRGRIVYVERVDPDGDGDLHVVIADGSVTAPGLTSVDVRPGLRPERDPRVGEQASAAGQVQRGSFDQQQIHAVEFHAAGG